ncbi:MAG: NAD(P)-dependent oxidoreductase [Bradymonadales bacterium]|nr:NAD(P)-dependent oxidoreductase [Bradymonadales bacterium]
MSAPKSLVTGACGFIGTHVVEDLVSAGHTVIATDVPAACEADDRKAGKFPGVLRELGVTLRPADIRNKAELAEVVEPVDYVFHIASVFNYHAPWELYRSVNIEGTRNLLELVQERASGLKRFVLWGAGGTYGLPRYQDGPFHEEMPAAPGNDYLRSKWFQEHLTMRFCGQNHISYSILRPTTVYGPRQVYGFGKVMMQNAIANPVVVPACLTGRVPLIHAKDVAGAALHLATTKGGEGIFNVNDDTVITTVELMELFAEWGGHRCVKIPYLTPGMLTRTANLAAGFFELVHALVPAFESPIERPTIEYLTASFEYDNSKLKGSGYRFHYPEGRVGLRETLDWFKREGWLD